MVLPVNATGWSQLMNLDLAGAAYTVYDNAFFGFHLALPILFLVTQFMLYIKTRDIVTTWLIGLFTAAMYISTIFVDPVTRTILMGVLIIETAGILYYIFFK
jgi:hypothetical protein